MNKTGSLICAAIVGAAVPAIAEDTRHADSHVHGTSTLNIAIEENSLLLELESPAADLIGFEHAPRNEAESQQIADAIETLKKPTLLFVPDSAAQCSVVSASVKSFGEIAENDGHGEHGDHGDHGEHGEHGDHGDHGDHDDHDYNDDQGDHDHDHAHDHEGDHKDHGNHDHHDHDDHDHGHDDHDDQDYNDDQGDHDHDHDHGADAHSEFYALWTWACKDASRLSKMASPFFDQFPNAQEIQIRIVADSGQAERTASRDKPSVSILPLD